MTNFSKIIKVAGVAAFALATASALTARAAHAEYACKSAHYYHNGLAIHLQAGAARAMAINNWRQKAKTQHGNPWSVWSIAKGKTTTCAPMGSNRTQCVARARPCKHVVG